MKKTHKIILMLLGIFFIIFILLIFSEYMIKFKNAEKTESEDISVAIVSMIRKPKSFEEWLTYHKKIGISKFYIRLEDTPELEDMLRADPSVHLQVGSSEDIPENQDKTYDSIYARQRDMIVKALEWAKKEGVTWLASVDCDELIDCKENIVECIKKEISGKQVFNIILQNYEAQYDRIKTENDSCFEYKSLLNCSEPGSKCVSYANGKSIGRVSYVKEDGPHRFAKADLAKKQAIEITSKEMRLLHFDSCDFESYIRKFSHLSKKEVKEYPFQFYNESIRVAKSEDCKQMNNKCLVSFSNVYKKYKVKQD